MDWSESNSTDPYLNIEYILEAQQEDNAVLETLSAGGDNFPLEVLEKPDKARYLTMYWAIYAKEHRN